MAAKKDPLSDIFKDVDNLNQDACLLSENTLSNVDEYIDTGSMALNAIISGSLYKGVPRGRITGLTGPSQCGKSLMVKKLIANAQRMGYYCVVWDTEVAIDSAGAEKLGVDTKRVRYYPVESVEECRNQMVRFLDNVIASGTQQKFFIFLDSLGNLASTKELEDASKGKDAQDMGLRAKALKSMMRCLTYKCAKARIPLVFTNHIYDDPGATTPSLVKIQSGGKGAVYLASLLVQFSVKHEKNDETAEKLKKMYAKKQGKEYVPPEDGGADTDPVSDTIAISHNINGVTLSALTVKNRFIPPFLKTDLYLNFKLGFDKYSGLLEMAQAFEIVESGVTWKWKSTGESIGYRKNFERDEAFWAKLLPLLEAELQKQLSYNSETVAALTVEVDELAREAAETPET